MDVRSMLDVLHLNCRLFDIRMRVCVSGKLRRAEKPAPAPMSTVSGLRRIAKYGEFIDRPGRRLYEIPVEDA
jgi:hypothetical protein